MVKTRYARKVSKRKGATKRRANTKRRVIKKKGRSMTKRRGGSMFDRLKRGAKRLERFGSMGVKNAATGIGNVATHTKDRASTAANYAANKASTAANYAITSAQNRIANVYDAASEAASEAACVGIDEELADAMKSLQKANDKVQRLTDRREKCNPAYGLSALGI